MPAEVIQAAAASASPSRPAPEHVRGRAFTMMTVLMLAALVAGFPSNPAPPVAPKLAAALRIDPNRATANELMLLPGIGPQLAAGLIRYREAAPAQPAFRSAADLGRVPRIGPATVERLSPYLSFPAEQLAFSETDNP